MSEPATEPVVVTHVENGIATITVNRPKALNALNSDVLDGIRAAVEGLPESAQGILLTGAGEKAFVAGADIAQMVDFGADEAETFSRRGQQAFQALAEFNGPVVAAINGFALGGGLELAMACDILSASEKARLGLPETTLAVIPGFGGTQRLPRRVGPGVAKRLLFTGDMIRADEALRIGLVDAVVAPDDLMSEAQALLGKALSNGPVAVAESKRLVDAGLDMPLEDAIAMEAVAFGAVFATKDQKEGMRAFLDKRSPEFKGS